MNTPAVAAKAWRIGLVGYGEVGRIVAEDLRAAGVARVAACDVKLGTPAESPLVAHAAAHGVELVVAHAQLAAGSDLILSAVTASQALAVAEACAAGIAGGRYVEGAVMTSVPPYRIRVPLILGGPDAAELLPRLVELGFAPTRGQSQLGIASATKMCRSVMIKGLEAMVIESFTAARAYGVEDAVVASLAETFPGIDWERQATYFFQRVVQHGRRRAEEMREVAVTVREAGLEPWSAGGTAERQAFVADLADAGVLGDRGKLAADWRVYADALLAQQKR